MSRQYDDFVDSHYEYNGEWHGLVDPENLPQLASAFNVVTELQDLIDRNMPDDAGHFMELQKEQYDLILGYTDGLGSFDNGILMRNIALLVKKYKLRMADLERMLGISTGYISRTAKEGSGKRMSIDIAWKIARIFNVELSTLLTVDMQELKGNTAVLLRFLDKLTKETEDGRLQWTSCGGVISELDPALVNCGLCSEAEDDKDTIYHPDHLNQELIWRLTGDIMKADNFGPDGEDLLMIPYRRDDNLIDNRRFFDFLFSWDGSIRHNEDYAGLEWSKVFYTDEDVSGLLAKAAAHLHELAAEQEFDAKVDPEVRDFIEGYLG